MNRLLRLSGSEVLTSVAEGIGRYEQGARSAMARASAAVAATQDMLSMTQRARQEVLRRAEAELSACLSIVYEDGSRPDCSPFVAAVTAAREALAQVEAWIDRVNAAADAYRAAEAGIRQSLVTRCPTARAVLETKATAVEQWEAGGVASTPMPARLSAPTPGANTALPVSHQAHGQAFQDVSLGLVEDPSFEPGEWQQADIAEMKRSFGLLPTVRNAIGNGTIDALVARDPAAQRVYDWFYGQNAVRLDWYQGRLTITNGKHRVKLARMLGVKHLPAIVSGTP